MDDANVNTIVDAMTEKVIEKDIRIIDQGAEGNDMFVSDLVCNSMVQA